MLCLGFNPLTQPYDARSIITIGRAFLIIVPLRLIGSGSDFRQHTEYGQGNPTPVCL